jgi:hypothetical protein
MCTVAAQLLYKLFTTTHCTAAVTSICQQQQYPTLHTALLLLDRNYTAVVAYLEYTLFGSCSNNYSSSSSSSTSIGSSSSATYASPRKLQQQQQQQQRQQQYVNLAEVQTVAVTHDQLAQKAGILFEREGLVTGLTTVRAIASTSSAAAAAADTATMSDMLTTEAFPVHQNGHTTTSTTAEPSHATTATPTVAWLRAAILAAAVVALPVPANSSSSSSSGSSTSAVQCMYEAMKQRLLMVPLQERHSRPATTAVQSGVYRSSLIYHFLISS